MDNIFHQELLSTLQKTFAGSSTAEIKNAEANLKLYEDKSIESLPSLIRVLDAENISIQLKIALVNFLKRVITGHLNKHNFQKDKILSMIVLFITYLFSSNDINDNLLNQIGLILIECCSNILISNEPSTIYEISNAIDTQFTQKTSVALSLYQMLVSSKSCNPETLEFIEEQIMKNIKLLISSQIDANNIIHCKLLRKGLDLMSLFMKKLNSLELLPKYLPNYINIFSHPILSIIEAYTADNNIVSFIQKDATPQDKETVLLLNTLKAKCLFIISSFIQLSNKTKIDNETLLSVLTKLIKAILLSLSNITQNNARRKHINSQQNLKEVGYEPIIYQSLFVICKCISKDPFYSEFQPNCFEIIFTILFQFLCTTKSNIIELRDDFESYYIALIDAMYDFKLKNIKTVAGFLLSYICDNFDSMSLKVLEFIFQLLNYNMNEIDQRSIGKYPLINNPVGLNIIEGFPNEIQIDCSLFCMCILAKHTLKNEEIKKKLKEFLIVNQIRLHDMTSVLIKYKICLIYGLCLDELFQYQEINDNKEAYTFLYKSIEFLFNLLFNHEKDISLSFQALHSLEDLVPLKDYRQICNLIVRNQMDNVIGLILTIKIDFFFDILSTIVTSLDVEEWIIKIGQLTVQRLQSDMIDSHYQKNEFIIKEFYLIKVIIDKTIYSPAIEGMITPILSYLKSANKIFFTDELSSIILSIANNQNNMVQPVLFELFPSYKTILTSDTEMSSNLFQILNYLIVNDKTNAIQQNLPISQLFNDIIKTSFGYVNEYHGDSSSPLYTLLLIQIWLMSNNIISNKNDVYECINNICTNFMDLATVYKDNINDFNNTYDVYMVWLYLSVLYSALINYSSITLEIIYNKNIVDIIIAFTDELINTQFFSCQLAKSIIIGICNMLSQKESLIKIFTSFGSFFRLLFKFIRKQYTEEVRINKNTTVKYLNQQFVKKSTNSSDEEDDDDKELKKTTKEDAKERDDDKKVHKSIEIAKFPILGDEFSIFNLTITQLNTINDLKSELTTFENSMDDEDKKIFKIILETRRVKIESNQQEITVPRKIYKVKRSTNDS